MVSTPPPSPPATTTSPPAQVAATVAPWTLPAPRAAAAAGVLDGHLIVAGGIDPADTSTTDVTVLGPADGQATPATPLHERTHDAGAAVLGGRLLVVGGGTSASIDTVQVAAGTGAGTVVGHLPSVRSDHAVATVDGTAYVVGGYDGRRLDPDVLATTDGAHFDVAARLPVPVRYPAVAAHDSVLWVFGGTTADGAATDVVQRVDTATGDASVAGHLPVALAHAAAGAVGGGGGQLVVVGGRTGDRLRDEVWTWDPATTSAARSAALPAPTADAPLMTLDGVGYLLGGRTIDASGTVSVTDRVVVLQVTG